jgi:DinB superfamily
MRETAENLRKTLTEVLPLLQAIEDKDASIKPLPQKWSKKEILGHLIDSACNNQQKFVRTMAGSHVDFVGYQQNFWVDSQKYNAAKWHDLISLWSAYNLHLAHLIENVNHELLANEITIETAGTFTLEFIMTDYVEHLKHHLGQILPEANLQNNFQNIYNT